MGRSLAFFSLFFFEKCFVHPSSIFVSSFFRQKKKAKKKEVVEKNGGGRGASALTADAPRGGETRVHLEKRARDFYGGVDDSDDSDDGSEREGLRASALVSLLFLFWRLRFFSNANARVFPRSVVARGH